MYALTFASSVAHLFFEDGDLVCGMMGERAKLVSQLRNDGLISKPIDRGLLEPATPCRSCLSVRAQTEWHHGVGLVGVAPNAVESRSPVGDRFDGRVGRQL